MALFWLAGKHRRAFPRGDGDCVDRSQEVQDADAQQHPGEADRHPNMVRHGGHCLLEPGDGISHVLTCPGSSRPLSAFYLGHVAGSFLHRVCWLWDSRCWRG